MESDRKREEIIRRLFAEARAKVKQHHGDAETLEERTFLEGVRTLLLDELDDLEVKFKDDYSS
jgi:hypothetical protein